MENRCGDESLLGKGLSLAPCSREIFNNESIRLAIFEHHPFCEQIDKGVVI